MSLWSEQERAEKIADRLTDNAVKKELLPAYKDSLDNVRKDLATLYEKYAKDGKLKMADVSKYNRLKNLEDNIAREMGKLGVKQTGATTRVIKDVYQESFYRTSFGVESEAQAKLGFGELPSKQVEAAVLNPMDAISWNDRAKEHRAVATRQVKERITRGIIQGKSYPDVAREVRERLNVAATKAERIVRTESHRAREEGKMDSLKHAQEKGVDMEKVWTSTLDDRTRDSHQELDGVAVSMYDEEGNPGMFTSPETGGEAEYPGGFGSAEEDINCRCAVRGQIKGYEPEVRRAREDGTIPYTRYPDYAESKGWPRKYKGPEPRVPEFVPARTTEEAHSRMGQYVTNTKELEDVELSALNEILRANHKTRSMYDFKTISFGKLPESESKHLLGQHIGDPQLGRSVEILFKDRVLKNPAVESKVAKAKWTKQYNKNLARAERSLESARKRGDSSIKYFQEEVDILKATKRFGFAQDCPADEFLFALTAHENGHAIQIEGELIKLFDDMVVSNKVSRIDMYRVSEYAATSNAELFAEVTAAKALGRSADIPSNVLKAYDDTVKRFR